MPQYNEQWLDGMYNNRALVPEYSMHLVRWAVSSHDARDSHANQRDVKYGDGAMETLDVFPSNKPGAPVVVFIHGGYWRALDKSEFSFIAPAFKNEGACVMIPNYDLCPAVTVPQIVMQMAKALAWVYRNARKYGGDPKRISVVGHSAGGHLATMMLSCAWTAYAKDLPADLVKGAMSISGLYDLEPLQHTPFLKESLQLTEQLVALASPAFFSRPRSGRLYTVVGAQESAEYLRQNSLMHSAWGKKTVPVCESIVARNHYSVLEDLSMPWERVYHLAQELVAQS